jgi:predicted  nucleic acid-binding Zn-ribbon protein
MQLLEEKHTEELQLYKLKLAQAELQISQLETKLQGYNSRKSSMVEKLHSLMETQWQEALRIVGESSPVAIHGAEHTRLQVHQKQTEWEFKI